MVTVPTPTEVYLDTNAVGCLLDSGARTQSALRQQVAAGGLSVVTSLSVMDELSGLSFTPGVYKRAQKMLLELAGPNVLPDNFERIRIETLNQGPLSGTARFLSRADRRALLSEARSSFKARQVAEMVSQRTNRFQAEFTALRQKVLVQLGKNPVPRIRGWWSNAEAHTDEWTEDYLRDNADILPPDADSVPPRKVPSAWHKVSFYLAWIKQTVGEGRKIQDSDQYDVDHYVHATYVDLMVTDDKRFRETCGVVPKLPFRIEKFTEFVHRLSTSP